MKKILIISFLIFTILTSFLNISYAVVTVTEKNLNEALQKFSSFESNVDKYNFSVSNNIINITSNNGNYTLNYSLTNKPTFWFEVPIEKGMSYEDFKKEIDNLTLPIIGYVAVSNIQGINIEYAYTYIGLSLLTNSINYGINKNSYIIVEDSNNLENTGNQTGDSKKIYASEFGDRVMEYVNSMYKEKPIISDSSDINSYSFTIEMKDTTATSCKLVSTLEVNTDADFSKINEFFNKNFPVTNITKENADYALTLKVGQKLKVETDVGFFGYIAHSADELDLNTNGDEITAKSPGTATILYNIGAEQKSFFITVEENTENKTFDPIIVKIENIKDILSMNNITKENTDYFVELNVGEIHNLALKNYSFHPLSTNSLINNNIINFDTTNSSEIKITGLKPGVVRGYIYQKIDEVKSELKYIYISVNENENNNNNNNNNNNSNNNNNNNNNTNNNTNNLNQNIVPEVVLQDVIIITPTQTMYNVGENLNLDGLKITAIYNNDSIKEVTKGYTVTGYNKNKEGKQTVKISYKGFSRSYTVQVGNSSIDIDNSDKLPQTGDFFDLKDGLYLLCIISSLVLMFIILKSFKYNKHTK